MRTLRTLTALAVLALALGACSGSSASLPNLSAVDQAGGGLGSTTESQGARAGDTAAPAPAAGVDGSVDQNAVGARDDAKIIRTGSIELEVTDVPKALRTARDLSPPHRLFVNVVPASMYDPDFQGASLIRLLEGLGLSPERIVLEVSEQYAIENYTLFVEALQNFTQIGFSIAVDDIGAGYSGLEKIAHLNPRYLKFDMQLVRDIDRVHVKREMARALKTFADKMDSQIIAEGIERDGERQACVDLGLHYGQGYLLARPAPLETFNLGVAAPSSARG